MLVLTTGQNCPSGIVRAQVGFAVQELPCFQGLGKAQEATALAPNVGTNLGLHDILVTLQV